MAAVCARSRRRGANPRQITAKTSAAAILPAARLVIAIRKRYSASSALRSG